MKEIRAKHLLLQKTAAGKLANFNDASYLKNFLFQVEFGTDDTET